VLIYTGCPILNNALRFLENFCGRYGKMCQTKVVWFGGGHKKVSLIWLWMVSLKLGRQNHIGFF